MASKPKAPVKDKKAEAKELEAKRLAEEARLAEEQRLREKEEARKRETLQLPTGLTLYLNEYSVQDGWKSEKPKEFFIEFISRILKDRDVLENFEPQELALIAEFNLYNLIYAKEELQFDEQKTIIFLNLFWLLLTNRNPLYEKKFELSEYDAERKEKLLRDKNIEADLAEFKAVVMNHCIDNPPNQVVYFDPSEAKKILDYAKKTYFMHFNLYKYVLLNQQKDKEIKITVYVDNPLPLRPLNDGSCIGKEKADTEEDAQAEYRRQAEELKQREEEERLQLQEIARKQKEEEDNRLDPKTLSIIQAKIKETKELFDKQLEERKKNLNDKYEALTNPKKKK